MLYDKGVAPRLRGRYATKARRYATAGATLCHRWGKPQDKLRLAPRTVALGDDLQPLQLARRGQWSLGSRASARRTPSVP